MLIFEVYQHQSVTVVTQHCGVPRIMTHPSVRVSDDKDSSIKRHPYLYLQQQHLLVASRPAAVEGNNVKIQQMLSFKQPSWLCQSLQKTNELSPENPTSPMQI